jgi:hypothetical protein
VQAIEAERSSRAIVYWTSDLARVSEAAVLPFYDQLQLIGKTDRLDLPMSIEKCRSVITEICRPIWRAG